MGAARLRSQRKLACPACKPMSLVPIPKVANQIHIVTPICPTKARTFAGTQFHAPSGGINPPEDKVFAARKRLDAPWARLACARKENWPGPAASLCHSSRYPKLRIKFTLSRQFSFTFTQVCKYTLVPIKRSISWRARDEIFFSMAPPLPMMMPLWLFFSQ